MPEYGDKLAGFNDRGYAGKSRRRLLFIGIGYIVQLNAGIVFHRVLLCAWNDQ
jgi:hypothetical protein